MKVNSKLLEKYVSETCTDEEKKLVETWLSSNNEMEENIIADEVLDKMVDSIWSKLSIDEEPKIVPIYKKVIQYTAVACFALMLFGAGFLSSNFFGLPTKFSTQLQSKSDENYVSVFTDNNKVQKVNLDKFKVTFQGVINLYNKTNSKKTIICNGIAHHLEPNKLYILYDKEPKKIYDSNYMINMISENLGLALDNNFEICI